MCCLPLQLIPFYKYCQIPGAEPPVTEKSHEIGPRRVAREHLVYKLLVQSRLTENPRRIGLVGGLDELLQLLGTATSVVWFLLLGYSIPRFNERGNSQHEPLPLNPPAVKLLRRFYRLSVTINAYEADNDGRVNQDNG